MNKNNEDQPGRRSSYVELRTGDMPVVIGDKIEPTPQPSEEIKQSISEARAAMVAELQTKLDYAMQARAAAEAETFKAQRKAEKLQEELHAKNEAIENMGAELAELHNKLEDIADTGDEEESAADTFFKSIERHLTIHDGGVQEILRQIEAKSPIERVAFIRGVYTLADVMQRNTNNLVDLAKRSEIALEMVEG